ncbi:MAG: LbtU family siderophore porin [Gammaproteobacteria bacterium]
MRKSKNQKTNQALVAFAALALGVASASGQAETVWPQHLEFGGTLEIEAIAYDGYTSDFDYEDVTVAALELGIGVTLSERLMAEVGFLYEEDETDFGVDIAVLHLALSDVFTVSAGQVYIPFGRYETALVNDPFTLELGVSIETALLADYNAGTVKVTGYVFNGDVSEASETGDTANSFGVRVAGDAGTLSWGVDFMNNLADSDGISESVGASVPDLVSALSVYGSVDVGGIALYGEYLRALDDTQFNNQSFEPSALHLEAVFSAAGEASIVGAIQRTDDARFLLLPETRLSIGYRTMLDDIVDLGAEFFFDEDYGTQEGGTNESALGVVVNVAVSF